MNYYACYHKPTKLWSYFRITPDGTPIMGLCLKIDCTAFSTKEEAETILKRASFNGDINYGIQNFSEFQIKKTI